MADEATTQETAAAETSGDSSSIEESTTSATEVVAGESALGDAGKKALDAMKADRNKYRDELSSLRSEFSAFKAKAEGTEAEHAAAIEAQRVKDEALAAANKRILAAELRGAAKGRLADPADALTFIDLDQFEVGDDGAVDSAAIEAALDALTTNKPYLAVQDGKRFQGGADAGARKESRATQLSREELAGMSPDQIEAARKEGRLNNLMGVK